jgi:hypothetical protein
VTYRQNGFATSLQRLNTRSAATAHDLASGKDAGGED